MFAPLAALVRRREPTASPPTYTGVDLNVRPVTEQPGQAAPSPIRASEFAHEGKPPAFAVGHHQFFYGFNIPGILSVMQDDFALGKSVYSMDPSINRGIQIALVERANIYRPEARAYGSDRVVTPFQPFNDPRMIPGPYSQRMW